MKLVGVDAALNETGVVVLQDPASMSLTQDPQTGLAYCSTVIKTRTDDSSLKRIMDIRNQVWTATKDADLVCVEDFAWGAATPYAHDKGGLGYALRIMWTEQGIRFVAVNPMHLKRFACGSGNAKKELIIAEVLDRFKIKFFTSHEADGYILARIGAALLGKTDGLTALQRGVVDDVRSGGKKKAGKGKAANKAGKGVA